MSAETMPAKIQLPASFESLDYRPDLFVGRKQEIGQVALLVNNIGRLDSNRVLIFQAQKGGGASWFAHHLVETVIPGVEGAVPFLISFKRGQPDCADNEFLLPLNDKLQDRTKAIMTWIAGKIGSHIPPNPDTSEIIEGIRGKILARSDQKPVFVFDAMYEGDWDLVEQLNSIFGGWAGSVWKTGIVIVSRGREVPGLVDARRLVLPPLTLAETKEQLEIQRWGHKIPAEEIFRLGGGYPLNTDLLAQKDTPAEALVFAWEQLTAGQSNAVKNGILAVALSGGVDHKMIGQLLGLDPVTPRTLITQINAAHMWQWQDSQYQVHESVAMIADNFLRYQDREKWAEIHRRSQALFLSLAPNAVPRVDPAQWAEYFNNRAGEHEQALRKYDLLFSAPTETEASIKIGQDRGKVRVIKRSDDGVVSLKVLSGFKGAPETLIFSAEEYWLDREFAVV